MEGSNVDSSTGICCSSSSFDLVRPDGQMAVLQRRQLVPAATNTREGLPTTKDPERSKTMRSLCLCRRKMRLLGT